MAQRSCRTDDGLEPARMDRIHSGRGRLAGWPAPGLTNSWLSPEFKQDQLLEHALGVSA